MWSFATDDSFTLIAKAFGGGPERSAATTHPEVGLIVDTASSLAPAVAAQTARTSDSSSIALTQAPGSYVVDAVTQYRSDVVPQLKPGGPLRWIGTRAFPGAPELWVYFTVDDDDLCTLWAIQLADPATDPLQR